MIFSHLRLDTLSSGTMGGNPFSCLPNLTLQFRSVLLLNQHHTIPKERAMEWTTPNFEEIDLGCEINSYANAEL